MPVVLLALTEHRNAMEKYQLYRYGTMHNHILPVRNMKGKECRLYPWVCGVYHYCSLIM